VEKFLIPVKNVDDFLAEKTKVVMANEESVRVRVSIFLEDI